MKETIKKRVGFLLRTVGGANINTAGKSWIPWGNQRNQSNFSDLGNINTQL